MDAYHIMLCHCFCGWCMYVLGVFPKNLKTPKDSRFPKRPPIEVPFWVFPKNLKTPKDSCLENPQETPEKTPIEVPFWFFPKNLKSPK